MKAFQKELGDIAMAKKQENIMDCVRAIESLHSLTNDIARIIYLAPSWQERIRPLITISSLMSWGCLGDA